MAPRVAIFCEGATEARILKELRGHWRVAAAEVHLVASAGDPWSVVDEAAKYKRLNRRDSPTVVVVFDRDAHERWGDAMERARALDLVRAVSNPCIELWGLLLHQEQRAAIERHEAQRLLATMHPGYDHNRHPYFEVDQVLPRLEEAERRAVVLRADAERAGDRYRNPSTEFGAAIGAIRPKGMAQARWVNPAHPVVK